MKKLLFIVCSLLVCTSAWSQQGSVPPMVVVCRGVLTSDVDSATAEAGQELHIKLREGCKAPEFQMGRNTDLVVVIAEVTHGTKSQSSMLHLVFDRAVSDRGEAVPVLGIVQAVAPKNMPKEGRNTVAAPTPPAVAGGPGGIPSGAGGSAGVAAMAAPTLSGSYGSYEGPADWHNELQTDATGVIGFKEFELQNDRSFPGTKFSSQRNFKLLAGTQLIVRVMRKQSR